MDTADLIRPMIILTPSTPVPPSDYFSHPVAMPTRPPAYNTNKTSNPSSEKQSSAFTAAATAATANNDVNTNANVIPASCEKAALQRRFADSDLLGPPTAGGAGAETTYEEEEDRLARAALASARRKMNLLLTFFCLLLSTVMFATLLHPSCASSLSRLPSFDPDSALSPSSYTGDDDYSAIEGTYYMLMEEAIAPPSSPPTDNFLNNLVKRVSIPFSFVQRDLFSSSTSSDSDSDDNDDDSLARRSDHFHNDHYPSPLPLLRFAHSSATSSRHESPAARSLGKRSAIDVHERSAEEERDMHLKIRVQQTKRVQDQLMKEARGRLEARMEARGLRKR